LRIVDRAYLIHQGKVLTEGTGEYLINDAQARGILSGEILISEPKAGRPGRPALGFRSLPIGIQD